MPQKTQFPIVRINEFAYWQLEELAKRRFGKKSSYLAWLIHTEFTKELGNEFEFIPNPYLKKEKFMIELEKELK